MKATLAYLPAPCTRGEVDITRASEALSHGSIPCGCATLFRLPNSRDRFLRFVSQYCPVEARWRRPHLAPSMRTLFEHMQAGQEREGARAHEVAWSDAVWN